MAVMTLRFGSEFLPRVRLDVQETRKTGNVFSSDHCVSFGDSLKNRRIGRSSDNRALRNRAAHMTSKSDVMRACGRWPFPFLRNGDYLTPAFTDSPPCARFARRLAHSHGSLC